MTKNDKIRYNYDGSWYEGEVLEHAYWVEPDAYWIQYKTDDGTTKVTIARESDLIFLGSGIVCTCGIMAIGGGFHSSWCDRYIAGVKVN